MFNKIIAWVLLIISIVATIGWMADTQQESWLFVLVYMIGMIYINIRYLESLK